MNPHRPRNKQQQKAIDRELDDEWRVALVIGEIDATGFAQREILLADLLCAAWPSHRAQNQ